MINKDVRKSLAHKKGNENPILIWNDSVRIRLCGVLLDMLVNIDSAKFAEKVVLEGGQKVIYASLKKDPYDDLIASLLLWRGMAGAPGSWGDSCFMNKMMYGKQCTIFWHVDDIQILHVISKVVDGVLSKLAAKYGMVSALSFSWGRLHDYLVTRLDYGTKFKVRITMPKHIESILEAAAEDMYGISETPAANHMLTVREDGDTFTGTQDDLFRSLVANIFFVRCRSRPDLKTALAFLTTRVRNTDSDVHKKLACTIHYIRVTRVMEPTLEAESMDNIW